MSTQNGTTEKIKVVLTDTRPVCINPDNWPYLTGAEDKDWDGQHEFQAFRKTRWDIDVRQHAKGCVLVYARYSHNSAWQGERDYSARAGVRLAKGQDIVAAIKQVAAIIEDEVSEFREDDAIRFRALCRECIAGLPAEDLDCCPEVV